MLDSSGKMADISDDFQRAFEVIASDGSLTPKQTARAAQALLDAGLLAEPPNAHRDLERAAREGDEAETWWLRGEFIDALARSEQYAGQSPIGDTARALIAQLDGSEQ